MLQRLPMMKRDFSKNDTFLENFIEKYVKVFKTGERNSYSTLWPKASIPQDNP